MKKNRLTYSCLVKMRSNASWAAETWFAQHNNFGTVGAIEEAIRFYKILNRIERTMWNYTSRNKLLI